MKLNTPYDKYEVIARLRRNRVRVVTSTHGGQITLGKSKPGIRLLGYIDYLVNHCKFALIKGGQSTYNHPRRKPRRDKQNQRRRSTVNYA